MWKIAIAIFVFPDAESPADFSFFGDRSECSRDKKLFLETRPWSDSFSGAKIMAQKPKIGKISIPTKGNHGYFLTHDYNPQADWSRDTAKNVPAIIVAGTGVKGFKIH